MNPSPLSRRHLLCRCGAGLVGLVGSGALALAGCSREPGDAAAAIAADFDAHASCALDGMLLADYPGPKGQLRLAGQADPEWYCDTLELLHLLLQPEQVRRVSGAWVQDVGHIDWERPRGHWIDARSAHYVLGSRRKGSMGVTAAPFADAAAAQAFHAQHGGRMLAYADIRPGMVDLSGGALHDTRM
jgi:copper chaperone NosL